jgi:hypothetical protein
MEALYLKFRQGLARVVYRRLQIVIDCRGNCPAVRRRNRLLEILSGLLETLAASGNIFAASAATANREQQ